MIAKTILSQLGGNRFIAMTGSKNFIDHGEALSFHLVRNRSRANRCKITLDGNDTYKMEFTRHSKLLDIVLIEAFDNVYVDQLRTIFTEVTGLDTSL